MLGHVCVVDGPAREDPARDRADRAGDGAADPEGDRPVTEQRVERLFVDPGMTGHGIGAALLQRATAWAGARDRPLALEVVDANRSAALRLYRRLGWRERRRTPIAWAAGVASELVELDRPEGSRQERRTPLRAGPAPG